jgi:hypothetical protein
MPSNWGLCFAVLALSAVVCPVICDDYPIPWDAVPVTNDGVGESLPVGCTCLDTSGGYVPCTVSVAIVLLSGIVYVILQWHVSLWDSVVRSVCVKFDCPCVCDLTFGQCDLNCCCDADCTTDQKAQFEGANTCLPEGPAPSKFTKCIDLEGFNQLVEVNPKYKYVFIEISGGFM